MSSSAAPKPESDPAALDLTPGQYVIYPKRGLTMVIGPTAMTTGNTSIPSMQFRNTREKADFYVPLDKIATSGLRSPASSNEWENTIKTVLGSSTFKMDTRRWALKQVDMEEKIKKGDPVSLTQVLYQTLGPHRGVPLTSIKDSIPRDIALSSSERVLVDRTVELITGEVSFVTGMTLSETREMIFKAALSKSFAEKVKLRVQKNFDITKNANPFHTNINPEDFAGSGPKQIGAMPVGAPMPYPLNSENGRPLRQIFQPPVKARANKPLLLAKDPALDLDPAIRGVFRELDPLVPKGIVKGVFRQAGKHVTPEELDIITRLKFFPKTYRMSVSEIAHKKNMSVEEVTALCNQGLEKIRKYYRALNNKLHSGELLADYEEKRVREKPPAKVKAEKAKTLDIPAENKETYEAELRFMPSTGFRSLVLKRGAKILTTEELAIFSALKLRRRGEFETLDQVSQRMSMDSAKVVAIYDSAARTLRDHYAGISSNHSYLKFLDDYRPRTAPEKALPKGHVANIPEENKNVYESEKKFIPNAGIPRAIFSKAAKILSPEELAVFSAIKLRGKASRETFQQAADRTGTDLTQVIALHNSAVETLRESYKDKSANGMYPNILAHYQEKRVRVKAPPKITITKTPESNIPPENKEVYEAENSFMPKMGGPLAVFKKGAKILTAEELSVLSAIRLRSRGTRESVEQVSQRMGLDPLEVVATYNSAAGKMRDYYIGRNTRHPNLKLLQDYEEKRPSVVKPMPKEKPIDIPAENKEAYDAETKRVLVKGHLRKIFSVAGRILTPEELLVFSAIKLRYKSERETPKEIALRMGFDEARVIETHDRAVEKLNLARQDKSNGLENTRNYFRLYSQIVKPPRLPKSEPYTTEGYILDVKGRSITIKLFDAIDFNAAEIKIAWKKSASGQLEIRAHGIRPINAGQPTGVPKLDKD